MILEKRISLSLKKNIVASLKESRYYKAMKQLLSLTLMLASVVACAQTTDVPENLIGVKEVVAQIDSTVTAMYGWEPADSTYNPSTDTLVASILDNLSNPLKQSGGAVRQEAYNQARITWAEFKRLVDTDAYEKALNFYLSEDKEGKKAGDFLLYLKHSSQRYAFFSQVLRPLMLEYKGADEALEDYVNNLRLEKAMEEASIDLSANSNGYVPEVYPFVVRDLCMALAVMGEMEEAKGLASDMAKGVYGLTGDVLYCNFVATQLLAQMYTYVDKPDQAKTTWTDFRDYLLENKSDYNEESLTQCLAAIDVALKDLEQ